MKISISDEKVRRKEFLTFLQNIIAILPAKIVQRQGLQTRVHDLRARDRYPDKMKTRQHKESFQEV